MTSSSHFATQGGAPPNRAVPPGVGYVNTARQSPPPTPPTIQEHFATMSGQPPSRSVPPGVGFVAYPHHYSPSPPATPQPQGPPSPPAAPQVRYVRFAPSLPAPPPTVSSTTRHFESPGVRFNGDAPPLIHNGAAVMFCKDHVRVHFFSGGARPFDSPADSRPVFSALHIDAHTSMRDLILRLGSPQAEGTRYGITECIESRTGWEKGQTWTIDGPGSRGTSIKELAGEGEEKVVWLATFDREKHGRP